MSRGQRKVEKQTGAGRLRPAPVDPSRSRLAVDHGTAGGRAGLRAGLLDEALALAGILALAGVARGLAGALALAGVDALAFHAVGAGRRAGESDRATHQHGCGCGGEGGARDLSNRRHGTSSWTQVWSVAATGDGSVSRPGDQITFV